MPKQLHPLLTRGGIVCILHIFLPFLSHLGCLDFYLDETLMLTENKRRKQSTHDDIHFKLQLLIIVIESSCTNIFSKG